MSFKKVKESFSSDLEEIKKAGLWKTERIINSDQKSKIQLSDNQEVINMCANNYLGLANNPEVIQAAKMVLIDGALALPLFDLYVEHKHYIKL